MLALDLESDPGSCNHHDLVMVCNALCATLKRVANFSPSFDDVPNIVTSQKIIPFLPPFLSPDPKSSVTKSLEKFQPCYM